LSFIIYFNFLFIELFYSHYLSHSVFQINLDWLELIFFFKFDFSFNLIFWYWVDWELNIIICFDLFSFELSWSYDQICGFIRLIWVDSICYYLNIFFKKKYLEFLTSQTKFSPVVYIVFELVKLIGLYQVNLHSICFTRKISVMFKDF
jgi:hypothetical protein